MVDLLSISEASRLLGVCENTLRDWDVEGKFKASRTAGGHRRYDLEAIRKYLDANGGQEIEIEPIGDSAEAVKLGILSRWEKANYIPANFVDKHEKMNLALLLENTRLYSECVNGGLTSTQRCWLVKEGWARSKFRTMISVQVMTAPCSMVYYINRNINMTKVETDAVAAKTQKYAFTMFSKADFESVKELYANAIADEIDNLIFQTLQKTNKWDIESFVSISGCVYGDTKFSGIYDYIVGPEGMISKLKESPNFKDIDLYGISPLLDSTTFKPLAIAGKYPTSSLESPVFLPYLLVVDGYDLSNGKNLYIRSATFPEDKNKMSL